MLAACGQHLRALALTAATAATAAQRAQATDVPSVVLDTSSRLPPSGLLVGGGIEDVNNELYGGLYSQMIYGESFEEPASNGVSGAAFEVPTPSHGLTRPTWMPWSSTGFFAVSRDAFDGKQSQSITNGAIANFGVGQQGMYFVGGREYEGYLYVKAVARATVNLQLVIDGSGARRVLVQQTFNVDPSSAWLRLNFSLVPSAGSACGMTSPNGPTAPRAGICGYFGRAIPEVSDDGTPGPAFRTCYQCSGGFVVEVTGSTVLVDTAFLQPGTWGRWKGLPVRRDVAEAMFQTAGWQVVRLGGSMSNADGWRWKSMRGFPRQPYHGGVFHPFPSAGFAVFEALALCEAAGTECAITLNNEEAPADMADFVEYCHGGLDTHWGSLRAADGHHVPYRPFTVEIGNEQPLGWTLVEQVRKITHAMTLRAEELKLPFRLRFAVGQNIDMSNFDAATGALNVTRGMLEALKPYGVRAAWDAHIGGDAFRDADDFKSLAEKARELFNEKGGKTKLVVFEENGFTHNLQRALVHSRMHITASYLSDFFLLGTAANGLQVFGQNDDGWDQGQVFMTPDFAWLSPYGWSQSMLSRHAREFKVPVELAYRGPRGLDIGAYVSDGGAVGLRVVNWALGDVTLSIQLPWTLPVAPVVEAQVLTSANLTDVNPPSAPERVAPRPITSGKARLVGAGTAIVELPLAARSLVIVALRPAGEVVLLL